MGTVPFKNNTGNKDVPQRTPFPKSPNLNFYDLPQQGVKGHLPPDAGDTNRCHNMTGKVLKKSGYEYKYVHFNKRNSHPDIVHPHASL